MKINRSAVLLIFIALATLVAGTFIIRYAADNGIGVSPDSVAYIKTAESLLAGNGFYYFDEPLTHFPPLYPLLLAGSAIFSQKVAISAEWLHGILYGLNALLFGLAIYFSTRRSLLAMVLGILLFFSPQALLHIHSFAWSEPPFLTFALILFISLGFYHKQRKWYWFAIAALSLGFLMVTRYAGIAFVPVAAVCLYFCNNLPIKQKIKDTVLFLFLAFIPLGLWMVRNIFLTHAATDREFIYHPITVKHLITLINTIHSFYLPQFESSHANGVELLIVVMLMIFMLAKLIKQSPNLLKAEPSRLYMILFGYLFSAIYVAFLLLSISFYDAYTPLDERILFPVYIFFTISIFSTIHEYSHTSGARNAWLVLLVCSFFIVRINLPTVIETARGFHTTGLGYNKVSWNQSQTLEKLSSFPIDIKVFSNGSPIIRFKTDFHAESLPAEYSPVNDEPNLQFQEEMATMCTEINQGKALFVYLERVIRDYLPSKEEVLEACSPRLLFSLEDGSIYGEFKP